MENSIASQFEKSGKEIISKESFLELGFYFTESSEAPNGYTCFSYHRRMEDGSTVELNYTTLPDNKPEGWLQVNWNYQDGERFDAVLNGLKIYNFEELKFILSRMSLPISSIIGK